MKALTEQQIIEVLQRNLYEIADFKKIASELLALQSPKDGAGGSQKAAVVVPDEEEIETKKNELFPIDENPNTDWRMNHNDNMERYRRGFDSAIEWIVSRASG